MRRGLHIYGDGITYGEVWGLDKAAETIEGGCGIFEGGVGCGLS